jgi:broad specificity phosphatase PhoE
MNLAIELFANIHAWAGGSACRMALLNTRARYTEVRHEGSRASSIRFHQTWRDGLELHGAVSGGTDVQLNETGRRQAREAGRQMEHSSVSRVLVSPLQRAIETARLAFPSRLDLIEADELLIECDFGRLEGRPIEQVMQEHGITRKEQLAEILPDDGETWNGVVARCNLLWLVESV